jgi:hypothetical protein
MRVFAVIERPAVIRQILDHLGLPTTAPNLRAPPDPPDGSAADPPREWSYEPVLDALPPPWSYEPRPMNQPIVCQTTPLLADSRFP